MQALFLPVVALAFAVCRSLAKLWRSARRYRVRQTVYAYNS